MDFSAVDPMPVFMAATPDFVQSKPDVLIAYLKAWLDVAGDFKNAPQKVADVIYKFYADKGYNMSLDTFAKALSRVEVNPGFPRDLQPYMQQQAEILLADKKIKAIPDWKTALRPDFMERARAGS
jgi:ABC-type nitrate/sulfonate/bicarbonate transport system substrate-binding protein